MKIEGSEIERNERAGTHGMGKRALEFLRERTKTAHDHIANVAKALMNGMTSDNTPPRILVEVGKDAMRAEREAKALASDIICAARAVSYAIEADKKDPGKGDPGTGDPGNGDPGTGDPGNGGNDPGGATGKPADWKWTDASKWAVDEHREEFGLEVPVFVISREADASNPDGIALALRSAADELATVDPMDRANVDIVIDVPTGTFRDFTMAGGSKWDSKFISGSIFDARSVNIVGPEPMKRKMFEAGPSGKALHGYEPHAIVTPGRNKSGGDTIGISKGGGDGIAPRPFGRLRLFGLQVNCAGRAACHPSTGSSFMVDAASCHFGTDEVAVREGASMKWIFQMYLTSMHITDCSFFAPEIQEHLFYTHGHADGYGTVVRRCVGWGNGGQVLQHTERAYEVPNHGADLSILDDSVFTGFHKFAGRAGSAVTFAGGGLSGLITDTLILDNDPNDTIGQADNRKGFSYGALTVWAPQGETESYAHEQDGFANENIEIAGSIFAIRNGNRKLAGIHDARSVKIRDTEFLGAPAISGDEFNPSANMAVKLNVELDRKKIAETVDIQTGQAPAHVVARMKQITRGGFDDYVPVSWRVGPDATQQLFSGEDFKYHATFDAAGKATPIGDPSKAG